ncbi:MAG: AAA family ATPase [Pseudomonadota bacterium]
MSLRIVVLNPKGGSGKTTVAANLLAAYAQAGQRAALLDFDRQGSASRWLRQRSPALPAIHGIEAYQALRANVTRSFALRPPAGTQRLVVDTAAAIDRLGLVDATNGADRVLVPVLPSDIDIHAAARCVGDLLVHARQPRETVGVVANRVKRNTRAYRALMRFLDSLGVPVVAVLRDVQAYPRAAQNGQGVCELPRNEAGAELVQWRRLLRWLEHGELPRPVRSPEQAAGQRVRHLRLVRG